RIGARERKALELLRRKRPRPPGDQQRERVLEHDHAARLDPRVRGLRAADAHRAAANRLDVERSLLWSDLELHARDAPVARRPARAGLAGPQTANLDAGNLVPRLRRPAPEQRRLVDHRRLADPPRLLQRPGDGEEEGLARVALAGAFPGELGLG